MNEKYAIAYYVLENFTIANTPLKKENDPVKWNLEIKIYSKYGEEFILPGLEYLIHKVCYNLQIHRRDLILMAAYL